MIEIKNCSVEIEKKKIFEKKTFLFEPGYINILEGESGIGKSTFLLALLGLIDTKYDEYNILGSRIERKNSRGIITKKVSMVFQNFLLDSNLSVLDNMKLGNRCVDIKQLDELLVIFNLNINKSQKIKTLSGGQQQRIAIIRELIKDREIYLFDEPTSHLDEENAEIFFNYISKLSNKTILVISHREHFYNIENIRKFRF